MLETAGAARRARRVAAIVLVAMGLAACSGGGRSPAGPDSAAAPTTTAAPGAPVTSAPAAGGPTTAPSGSGGAATGASPADRAAMAAGLAATLTRTERAIRDPATPDRELPALGHAQQRAHGAVVRDPALLPKVLSRVPAGLRPVVRANVAAGIDLRKLYVRAVTAYARQMRADQRAFLGYHQWQVYYGDTLLPEGYPARPASEG